MAKIAHFSDLEKSFIEGIHFRITPINRAGTILILAPHGGSIESGTSELAKAIAGDHLSVYLFEGLLRTARENQALHITSSKFDEPRCLAPIKTFRKALAIHGCGGSEPMICIGGNDIEFKKVLVMELTARGYPVQLAIGKNEGIRPTNICNRASSGKGVQLELSNGLRRALFEDWRTRKSRKITTALFTKLASDIKEAIS